jgi:uridine kinase
MRPVDLVRENLLARLPKLVGGAVVVALDGRSGSGKSTLAEVIGRELDAAVVHVDDFYRDMSDADRRALSPADGVDRYFDWQRLRDEALDPLTPRRPARFRCFDWDSGHGLGDLITVQPREVLVVEGVYSARPEFDDFVDLRVLVTVEDRRRMQRLDDRTGGEPRTDPTGWRPRWEAAEAFYFQTVRLPPDFDLIVPGDA